MIDEGYIKFKAEWTETAPLEHIQIAELNNCRETLYQAGLIGAYDNGIGYGNLSQRWNKAGQFIISGSKTGLLSETTEKHYSKVLSFDLDRNQLVCEGPVIASSESMSHAVIYQECLNINAVIHVHHLGLWKDLLYKVPTTDEAATYGSPEMAYSIIDLLNNSNLKEQRIFVMAGHEEGIFVFGETIAEALKSILQPFQDFLNRNNIKRTNQ
jgi:ribulose-5-phosphate 4-epimerase/fuculose-1-phosphate aldolase